MKILSGKPGKPKPLVGLAGDGVSYTQSFNMPLANLPLTGGSKEDHWGTWLDFGNINAVNIVKLEGREFYNTCAQGCPQKFRFRFTRDTETTSVIEGTDPTRRNLTISIGLGNSDIKSGTDIVNAIIKEAERREKDLNGANPVHTQVGHANGIAQVGSRLYFYDTAIANLNHPPTDDPIMRKLHATSLDNSGEASQIGEDLWVQNGANSGQGIWMRMPVISSNVMGMDDLSVITHDNARWGIRVMDSCISYVNDERARLGAYQNRLEHDQANVDVARENLTDSESRIRDADIADEMSTFTKENVIEQSAQSILAQANQAPNYILNLLK